MIKKPVTAIERLISYPDLTLFYTSRGRSGCEITEIPNQTINQSVNQSINQPINHSALFKNKVSIQLPNALLASHVIASHADVLMCDEPLRTFALEASHVTK